MAKREKKFTWLDCASKLSSKFWQQSRPERAARKWVPLQDASRKVIDKNKSEENISFRFPFHNEMNVFFLMAAVVQHSPLRLQLMELSPVGFKCPEHMWTQWHLKLPSAHEIIQLWQLAAFTGINDGPQSATQLRRQAKKNPFLDETILLRKWWLFYKKKKKKYCLVSVECKIVPKRCFDI